MTLVLCIYEYACRRGIWEHDSVMIEVGSSSQILAVFEEAAKARQQNWYQTMAMGARPEQWRLLRYRPQNGKRLFDGRH